MSLNESAAPSAVRGGALLTVALCFCVTLLEGFDIQALGIALGKMTRQFGLTGDQRTLLTTLSSVGIVAGAIIGGRLADLFGRKPVLLAAVAAFGVATLAMVAAPDFNILLGFRIVAGMGFGAALPIMMAMVSEVTRPEQTSMTSAIMYCGLPTGGGTVALLTEYLGPQFDWQVLFVVGGLAPIIVVPAMYLLLKETGVRRNLAAPPPGNFWFALFGEGRAIPTLLVWGTFLPTLTMMYLFLNWLPTLVASRSFGPGAPAQAAVLFNYCSILGAFLFAYLVDRFGTRWPLLAGSFSLIACLIALSQAADLNQMLFFSGLAGFLLLGASYAVYGIASAYYPRSVRGTGAGACVSVGRVGSILGPLLAGLWLQGGTSASHVIGYMVPFAALAGISVFALGFFPRRE